MWTTVTNLHPPQTVWTRQQRVISCGGEKVGVQGGIRGPVLVWQSDRCQWCHCAPIRGKCIELSRTTVSRCFSLQLFYGLGRVTDDSRGCWDTAGHVTAAFTPTPLMRQDIRSPTSSLVLKSVMQMCSGWPPNPQTLTQIRFSCCLSRHTTAFLFSSFFLYYFLYLLPFSYFLSALVFPFFLLFVPSFLFPQCFV